MTYSGNTKLSGEYLQKQFAAGAADSYVGILFEDIAAGTYTIDITLTSNSAGANVYVFPKSVVTAIVNAAPNTSGLYSAMVAKLKDTKAETIAAGASASIKGTFAGDAGNDYYVFFKNIGTGKSFLRITKLELTKTGDASNVPTPSEPAATEPAATEPSTTPATEPSTTPATTPSTTPATTPATNAPTTPADNAGADNGGFPVAAIVAIVVVVLGGAAAGVYFFLKKKKAA